MKFRTETELFSYLEKNAYAAVFSDILDSLDYPSQVISPHCNIRPLKENFVVIGRAVTLLNDYDGNKEEPYELVIKCIDSLKPNTVLVATGTDRLITGIMGELTATALSVRQCRGAIINGYTRDVRKILKMKFPTFAWGASPIDTTGRVRVIDYNIPITIGDVKISSQDLIFADLDGIIVIPRNIEGEVISLVIERINTENSVRNDLAEGKTMREVWKKYHVL